MTDAGLTTKRFTRKPPIKPLTVTVRDLDIVETVWRYRCIDSDDIAKVVGGSEIVVKRRLRLLFHSGYVDRPFVQIQWQVQRKNPPLVYLLGKDGAKLLEDYGRAANLPDDWTSKNQELRPGSILHMNAIAGVMAGFERLGRDRFIREETLLDREGKRRALTWSVELQRKRGRRDVRISPDHAFGVRGQGGVAYFFLEADRETMPITRSEEKQSSILEKLEAYVATIDAEIHKRNFGMHSFRVLFTVENSATRVENMISVVMERLPAKYHRNFLFAVSPDLRRDGVEDYQFWNGRGERGGLFEAPPKLATLVQTG